MYFKTDEKIVDGELQILREFLALLEDRLVLIEDRIARSENPEGDGLFDRGEYLIGIGFVAIQQYLYDTCISININRGEAFKLGPVHSTGIPWVKLIHEAANWWKHEAEWFKIGKVNDNTFSTVVRVIETDEYPMSNVLAAFTESHYMSFNEAVSKVVEWRDLLASSDAFRPARTS
ncbi:hypothetical protein [Pseudomonas putida]|uniref:Uncharacterized protein n=1 Tax=Pseudomonas putida TaxID=303 RepID=A0A7W2QLS7_PSEPU|nr:hypothetical protein [Pseudomonas putida]MBA6119338.1 hypothetical protein [Pseudomonas putida]